MEEYVEPCSIKVTRIGNWWHCRLYHFDKVYDEMKVQCRQDINHACHEMMRWYDKCGGMSRYASATRHRYKRHFRPVGRIVKVFND